MTPADKPDQTHAGDAGREESDAAFLERMETRYALQFTGEAAEAKLADEDFARLLDLARRAPAPGDADAAWAEYASTPFTLKLIDRIEHAFRAGHAANAGGTSDAVPAVERPWLETQSAPRDGTWIEARMYGGAQREIRYVAGFAPWKNRSGAGWSEIDVLEWRALPAPAPNDPEPAQPDRDAVIEECARVAKDHKLGEAIVREMLAAEQNDVKLYSVISHRIAGAILALRTGAAR